MLKASAVLHSTLRLLLAELSTIQLIHCKANSKIYLCMGIFDALLCISYLPYWRMGEWLQIECTDIAYLI